MKEVDVSIIVPVYNVEQYVDKCVSSILNQTYQNFELILVNDGSTDSSLQHLKQFIPNDRITIIDKVNTGQSDSRFQGLLQAKGRYIYFVDSDDSIEPNTIDLFMRDVQDFDSDIVYGRYRLIEERGNLLKEQVQYSVREISGLTAILQDALCINNIKSSLCLKLIKKELLLQAFTNSVRAIKLNEDLYLTILLSSYCKKITFRDEIVYNVLQRPTSITRNVSVDLVKTNDVIFQFLDNRLQELDLKRVLSKELYSGYVKSVLHALFVTSLKCSNYRSFLGVYKALKHDTVFFSSSSKDKVKQLPLKLKALFILCNRPFVFYLIIRLARLFFKY